MARLTGAALEAARRAQAASIKPGWAPQTLADWIPKKEKPTVQMLRAEIKERAEGLPGTAPKCGNWNGDRCIAWLADNAPPSRDTGATLGAAPPSDAAPSEPDDAASADDNEPRRTSRRLSGQRVENEQGLPDAAAARWSSGCHYPPLVNAIVETKGLFLEPATSLGARARAAGRGPRWRGACSGPRLRARRAAAAEPPRSRRRAAAEPPGSRRTATARLPRGRRRLWLGIMAGASGGGRTRPAARTAASSLSRTVAGVTVPEAGPPHSVKI